MSELIEELDLKDVFVNYAVVAFGPISAFLNVIGYAAETIEVQNDLLQGESGRLRIVEVKKHV